MAEKLSTWQEGINSLRKNDKGEGSQKLSLKRWGLEALKEEGSNVSSLGTPQNGKSTRDFWGRSTKIRKLWEIRKGSTTNVASTTLVLVPKGENGGNQRYPGTPGWHNKKGKQPTVKGIEEQWISVKILGKTPLELKKREKWGQYHPVSSSSH